MDTKAKTGLEVSPEEEAFLYATFRQHARSYLAVSVFALGLAVAGLGFGLTNASASDVIDTSAFHEIHSAQRAQIEAIRLEIAAQLDASDALTQRLTALEEQLGGVDEEPSELEAQLDDAYRRIRSLEKKQGIMAAPTSPGLYKRLNSLETRLSVIELERG
jgi:septal ring factor EnvC (AmiA/AmiB activator)